MNTMRKVQKGQPKRGIKKQEIKSQQLQQKVNEEIIDIEPLKEDYEEKPKRSIVRGHSSWPC